MLNGNISSIYLYNMVNFGPLTSETRWRVWGTPANFNTFSTSWLRYCTDIAQRRSTKLCTTFGRLLLWCTIYMQFWGLLPLTEFCQLQNSLCVQLLRSPKLTASLHGTRALASAKVCGVVQVMELRNFHRGRHLYSAGRPSRWASAHILVTLCCVFNFLYGSMW